MMEAEGKRKTEETTAQDKEEDKEAKIYGEMEEKKGSADDRSLATGANESKAGIIDDAGREELRPQNQQPHTRQLPWFAGLFEPLHLDFYTKHGFTRSVTGDASGASNGPVGHGQGRGDDNARVGLNEGRHDANAGLGGGLPHPNNAGPGLDHAREHATCCCFFHPKACTHLFGVVAIMTLLFAAQFVLKSGFTGPLAALGGSDVDDRLVSGFPEDLEIEWNKLNRSLRWWSHGEENPETTDRTKPVERVELRLPWDYLMLWQEDLPSPIPLTPAVVLDLVLGLLGLAGDEFLMADELVRIQEYVPGDRVLVKIGGWPEVYGGRWKPGTVKAIEDSTKLKQVRYRVQLDGTSTVASVSPFSLRPEHSLLILTPEEDMQLAALEEFRSRQEAARQEKAQNASSEHEDEEQGLQGQNHNNSSGNMEEDSSSLGNVSSIDSILGEVIGGADEEERLLDQLMSKWEQTKGLVVATERRLYLFQGYSFSHRGYWRFPGTELPHVSQPLKETSVLSFRPLDLLTKVFCTDVDITLPRVQCSPGDKVRAVWYGAKKRSLYNAVLRRLVETPDKGEWVWEVDWADDDESHRNISARDIYRFGYPCLPQQERSQDEGELKQEEEVTSYSDNDRDSSNNRAAGDHAEEIAYEKVFRCSRSVGLANMHEWFGGQTRMKFVFALRLHLILWGLVVYCALFGYMVVRHVLMFFMLQLPAAYIAINLLRHVDTPLAPMSAVIVMGIYAATPLIILRDILGLCLEAMRTQKVRGDPSLSSASASIFAASTSWLDDFSEWYAHAKMWILPLLFSAWMSVLVFRLRCEADKNLVEIRAARIAQDAQAREEVRQQQSRRKKQRGDQRGESGDSERKEKVQEGKKLHTEGSEDGKSDNVDENAKPFSGTGASLGGEEDDGEQDREDDCLSEEEAEDDMCRICLGGTDEGRLISPCLCRGSIRFVHLECLQHWRRESRNTSAFYECEMCKYRYSFHRTLYAQVLRSALVLHAASAFILVFLILASAHVLRKCDDSFFEGNMAASLTPDLASIDLPKDAVLPPELVQSYFNRVWIFGLTGPHLLLGVVTVGVVGWLCTFWHYIPMVWAPGRNRTILPILIIIGMVKVLTITYELMKRVSGHYLQAAENLILEVGEGYKPKSKRRRGTPKGPNRHAKPVHVGEEERKGGVEQEAVELLERQDMKTE
mmetsp:Transcript_9558/g.13360  ORF Transcript_9558/g.13360 Transcript_9558/m.13360 type:complete len:1184 (-) Transcript_9558:21-3572(-)|eukprot:CAMPEP_0184480894 /NCGR_PEP_ID=MMETSP0113_2-20130426/2409_1 /TAXON_ID=91329 /ORGANISM="Norrisiella sphaerica, Strain BC52" /LENGTH=1183 /DNA_ID=CAMNT_0026859681 /DNA_START=173 /DNA_END=3724 /DNA_ORIENTATION=-